MRMCQSPSDLIQVLDNAYVLSFVFIPSGRNISGRPGMIIPDDNLTCQGGRIIPGLRMKKRAHIAAVRSEPPGRPESIVDRLKRREAELPGRSAGPHLFAPAISGAGLGAMARFARAANVSPQTVLRLGQLELAELGGFQDRLRVELAAQQASRSGRWPARGAPQPIRADWLTRSAIGLPACRDKLAACPRPISKARPGDRRPKHRVLVIGGRFTQHSAGCWCAHLQIVRGGAEEIGSLSSTWPDRLTMRGAGPSSSPLISGATHRMSSALPLSPPNRVPGSWR